MFKGIGLNVLALRPARIVWASRRFQALIRLGLLLFSVWGGFLLRVQAQGNAFYEVHNYTTKDGLSNNHVYQTFQDSRGLIWVVTGNGIDLFDGARFESILEWEFSSVAYQNRICFEDEYGVLWIKKMKEDRAHFQWINSKTKQVLEQAPALFRDCKGEYIDLAAGPGNSLLLLDKNSQLWKKTKSPHPELLFSGKGGGYSFCTYVNNESVIWLRKMVFMDWESDPYPIYTVIFADKQVLEYTITDVSHRPHVLPNGILWTVGKRDYAMIIPGQKVDYQFISSIIPNYKVDLRDNSNSSFNPETEEIWIFNQGAMKVFRAKGELVHDFSDDKTVNSPKISFDIFIDRQGVVWVGTIAGVFKVVKKYSKFKRLVWDSSTDYGGRQERPCRGMVLHSNGKIYINASLETYSISPHLEGLRVVNKDLLGYYALAEDLDGRLVNALSTFYHLDPNKGRKVSYELPKSKVLGNIWSVLPQRDRIWLGNSNGLLYFDREKKAILEFELYNGYDLLRHSDVYQMVSLNHGNLIWLVSSTGIYEVDPVKGVVGRYWTGGIGSYHLPADNIRHLSITKTGAFWLATSTGLVFWDLNLRIEQQFGEEEGLLNTTIYAVYPDEFGFIWYSSDAGIGQLDYVSGRVRHYQVKDGVTHDEFNRISHLKLPDGTLFFGSMNGVTVLKPSDFRDAFRESRKGLLSLIGATVLSSSSTEKELDLLPRIYERNMIEIDHDQSFLKLKFALTDYSETSELLFSYKIQGYHDQWVPTYRNEIQLTGLPQGSYQLIVRAKNSSGMYYDQEFRLPVQVNPPFYLRKWVLVVELGLLLGLAHWAFSLRNQFLLNRQRELEQEVELRTRRIEQDKALIEQQAMMLQNKDIQKSYFVSNLTHELRTPISLILGPLKHLLQKGGLGQENTKILTIAQRNAKHLLHLVNSALDLMSLENHALSVHRKPVLIDSLVRELVGEFRMLALTKKISVNYYSEEQPKLELLLDEGHVRTILSNLLSNAIKYTAFKGRVGVYISYVDERVQLQVQDTGRGIHPDDLPHVFERFFQTQQPDAPAEGGTGIGLALCKELVELMDGFILVESQVGEGTKFKVEFPAFEVRKVVSTAGAEGGKQEWLSKVQAPVLFQRWKFDRAHHRPSILVAEDNQEMQQFLGSILAPIYQLYFVSNGKEALRYLQLHPKPDLLITDVMMPEMDGYQLVQEIKLIEDHKKIPILVLSARSERAVNSWQVDDYLIKPFEEEELLATIRRLIERNLVQMEQELVHLEDGDHSVVKEVSEEELEWLRQLELTVVEHIGNSGFTSESFAAAMLMGRTAFFQEVKRLTGMTPNQYILEVRLLEARMLLQQGTYPNFSAVVSAIGMKSDSYFSQLFRNRFGISPTVYFQDRKKV